MAKLFRFSSIAAVSVFLPLLSASLAEEYQLGCPRPPFPGDPQSRPIDSSCPNRGDSPAASPKGQQNLVKNDLCRQGNPITLSLRDFMSLQRQAERMRIPFGADGSGPNRVEHLPQDRRVLASGRLTINGRPIREGDKVQIVAFMDDPHYADVGRASPGRLPGEDVNCHNENEAENDIHINLVQRPAPPKPLKNDSDAVKERKRAARKAALCKAIVAEVIPHFRPAMFEVDNLDPIFRKKIPVRISGQLFFDASHRPCAGSTPRDSSVRGSLWEIHPIYSIDICKLNTLTQCSAANGQVWVSINDWLSSGVITSMELQATKAMRLQEEDDREGEHEGE